MSWDRSWSRRVGCSAQWVLALFALYGSLSCSADDRATVYVTLSGLAADSQTVGVKLTLDGQAEANPQSVLRQNLSQFQVHLPPATQGTLGIFVSAQGPDGCTTLSGSSELTIGSQLRYSTTIPLAGTIGCRLVVRKLGEGATRVVLSDDTSWDFPVPEPPSTSCPIESLVASEQSKTFPLSSKVSVRTVSTESTRGSYVALMEGCPPGGSGCEITISPDTSTVLLLVSRTSVCGSGRTCWEHPLPQGQDLLRVAGIDTAKVWAVGDGNALLYNGTYWTAPRRIALPSTLTSVLVGPENSIVTVGRSGYVLRLLDNQWRCPERPTTVDLNDIWGTSLDDFWAVGEKGTLLHWANNVWTAAAVSGVTQGLKMIRGRSPSDIYAVGEAGTVLHYDGSTWSKLAFPTTDTLYGLWLANDGQAWVVGDRGLSARLSGSQVELLLTGATTRLRTIYSVGGAEIWAAGDAGLLLRYMDGQWAQVESGTRQNLYSISGATSSNLWAVGAGGTILHYAGLYWTLDSVGRTARTLYGVSGVSNLPARTTGAIYAVGEQGTVLRNTSADWILDSTLSGLTPRTLRAVSTPSATDIWIAGDGGTILNWDGTQVGVAGVGTGADFYGIWAGGGSVVAVGSGGVMTRRSGATWLTAALPAAGGRTLRAVYGMAANALWLAGDGGTLLFWNGSTASSVPTGVTENLRGLFGTAGNNLWAVGDGGRILHYDGSAWSLHAQGSGLSQQNLYAVGGSSAAEILALGEGGTLLRFDGTSWQRLDSGMQGGLYGVWANGDGDARLVGQGGAILVYRPSR